MTMKKMYYSRKGMAYGGNVRKPMAYGGMMSASQPQQNMMQNNAMTSGNMNQMQTDMMQSPKLKMRNGGNIPSMKGDLDKDGKMSGYEKKRQAAIQSNMKKNKKA